MTNTLASLLGFLAALGSGLMAGMFFAFSVFVMAALGRLPPDQGIAAMQSINIVILNPVFLLVFMGTALLCVALAILSFMRWGDAGTLYVLAGGAFYLIGVIVVTMAFNVPLNDALAAVDPKSAEGAAAWARYLGAWTGWNHLRSVCSLAALASFVLAGR